MEVNIRGGGTKKIVGGGEESDGGTRIRVDGGVVLGANPRKSCNRFTNNYKAEFGLKHHQICGVKLALCTFSFFISLINPQLTALYCNFSYGSEKWPCKIFLGHKKWGGYFIY